MPSLTRLTRRSRRIRWRAWALAWALLATAHAAADGADPGFTTAERAWIRAHPVVVFVAETGLAPLEDDVGGEYTGLFSGYVAHVSQVSGLQFRYLPTRNWQDAQQRFVDGHADVFANAAPASLRPEVFAQLARSRPYFASPVVLIGPAAGPMYYAREDLDSKVIAVRARAIRTERIEQLFPGARFIPVASADAGLSAVAEGHADVVAGTAAMYFPRLRRRYVGTLGVASMPDVPPYMASMGVRRDNQVLLSIINKSLATMTAAQTDALEEQWLGMTADYGEPSLRVILHYHRWQVVLIVALGLLLAGTTYWAVLSRGRARRSEKAKARFLATMSHEIRTPINAMVGSIEMLKSTALGVRQRDLTDTAWLAAETLVDLLDNVLDLSRMDAGRLALERLPTDVPALMRAAVQMANVRAARKGLVVELDELDGQWPWLLLDATRLRQVVSNLLSNAVKFTEHGSVLLRVRLEAAAADDAIGTLVVSVIDTGIGISSQQQAELFRPYHQADQSTTRRYGGTGLGLVICRELVTLMGGAIELHSTPGQGTEVSFHLPVSTSPVGGALPAETIPGVAAPSAGLAQARGRVLVVEDHPVNQKLIGEQLTILGVDACVMPSGAQAIALLLHEAFDVVLMDCHMPEMDGYETTRRIRRDLPALASMPIIALSAATDASHLQECQASGMDGIVHKPVRLADLSGIFELWGVAHAGERAAPAVLQHDAADLSGWLQRDLAQLQDALHRQDGVQARFWAHRLHGVALSAGLDALAVTAEVMESCLTAGELPSVALLAQLERRVEAIVAGEAGAAGHCE
ncbi:MAG: response regulator [Gammaproteobacteria bacterium]|nr:response regulator [Gammaproteobacteria bacterium]